MQKILLVEDDPALLAGLQYSVEKDGYQVYTAGTVRDGWACFLREPPDLAVLDVGLPDGTGFDLCRRIREQSQIPILFLTARDEETQVVMGLDMGGDDYITKPFRLRELLSRIKALLRRSADKPVQTLVSDPFTLKAAESRLFRNNQEIALTPAEYRLLHMLMRHEGQTLTRDQLLTALWDSSGDFVDENTLSVYIRRLRAKVEDTPSHPAYIQTVRGVGYRWKSTEGCRTCH
ncbi:MAG: response regulator transcription factor [Ethanoligenens sp.]